MYMHMFCVFDGSRGWTEEQKRRVVAENSRAAGADPRVAGDRGGDEYFLLEAADMIWGGAMKFADKAGAGQAYGGTSGCTRKLLSWLMPLI